MSLFRQPVACLPQFSSDGRRLYFIGAGDHTAALHELALPGGQARRLTFRGRVLDFSPTPDGRALYALDETGAENAQLWLGKRSLTKGFESAVHQLGGWSPDGRAVLMTANRRRRDRFDLHLLSLDGSSRMLLRNHEEGFVLRPIFDETGRRVFFILSGGAGDRVMSLDLDSGRVRALAASRGARFRNLRWRLGRLLLLTDKGRDYMHLAELDPETGRLRRLREEDGTIEFFAVGPRGACVYAVNAHDRTELKTLDGARLPVGRRIIGSWDGRLAFSPDEARLAFSWEDARRPSRCAVLDLRSGRVMPVGSAPAAGRAKPEPFRVKGFDGLPLSGWLYRAPRRAPYVVLLHGGPEDEFRPGFDPQVENLLAAGFGVLAPNVRGSTGFGRRFEKLDDGRRRPDAVLDVLSFARALKRRAAVSGLACWGSSYGGFLTLAALAAEPWLWSAGVSIAGFYDFPSFLRGTSPYRRASREREYGRYLRFLASISPLRNAAKISAPVLLVHGARDARVPVKGARRMSRALRSCELLELPDEGHSVAGRGNRERVMRRAAAFLRRSFQGRTAQ